MDHHGLEDNESRFARYVEGLDAARCKRARVPKAIVFKAKPQIELEQVRAASVAGVPRGVLLMDASYDSDSGLRGGIGALGLGYVAGIRLPPESAP
jgi:SRSO17 transposase